MDDSKKFKIVRYEDKDGEIGYKVVYYPTTTIFSTRREAADAIYSMTGLRIQEQ